ncbi:alanine racemase [Actinoplanes sp. TFC3]|uniref:alanine racemase n=1 Tax=Actinoplanes sp. TFC3 TaxID=1710355 RepID=UPI000A507E7A|nr:alanine racemase [Actinoplanes sp. TFC3]
MSDADRRLRHALAAAPEDRIVYDLTGIEEKYDALTRELPGVRIRFAMKACPIGEVLTALASQGCGFDAASPNEMTAALRAGAAASAVHYGNTVKSDSNLVLARDLGIQLFATDSLQDVAAIAEHAPGAGVFCRVTTSGRGALWGLSHKYGCSPGEAVTVLDSARAAGLVPAGLSVHVGSQQMTADAWHSAVADLAGVIAQLKARGIAIQHVNLGGGLPAQGYLDRQGRPPRPRLADMFAAIRAGMRTLQDVAGRPLEFVLEPGRYLVADHGAIRAHVTRLTVRDGRHWLYLSCGKFNGLYEMDQLQYRMVFPAHRGGGYVPAVVAGPTCDSDDAFSHEQPIPVPAAAASGDPVWLLSSGAYATSYMTLGFNGFDPLPYRAVRDDLVPA